MPDYNSGIVIFGFMQDVKVPRIQVQKTVITSGYLERDVIIDLYAPITILQSEPVSLLLINDGQDLPKFGFDSMLNDLCDDLQPLICAGIHCGKERKMEYGTASVTDFKGRGARAAKHQKFVFDELLPFIHKRYKIHGFSEKAYAGFSLGGLSAIDTVWNHPDQFTTAGVFSGSLWWRTRDIGKGYVEETDRIMHKQIREGSYKPGLRFFFTTGSLDETMDRNNNGVIDSIDDTLALIEELEKKGYSSGKDIFYINYSDGRHDVETWGRAMPEFLRWGWGKRR